MSQTTRSKVQIEIMLTTSDVHGHVARAFVHHLHAFGPRAFGEFALHFGFAELRRVVRVSNRAGTQAVSMMAITQFNLDNTFQIQLTQKCPAKSANHFLRLGQTASIKDPSAEFTFSFPC